MSTIIASNISDGTTSVASTYVVNGSAKAWVNFNGTGTVAIRDSLNVSSITDNGSAHYSITVASALGNANYTVTAMSQDGGYGNFVAFSGSVAPTATDIRIYNFSSQSSTADGPRICLSYQGDLA
jgi:hypothetical protein